MFGNGNTRNAVDADSSQGTARRRFLQGAGLAGAGVVGAGVLGGSSPAAAAGDTGAATDVAVLNFALNLEYLEGEFYSYAVTGHGLASDLTDGTGTRGPVAGGHQVRFETPWIGAYAKEIAADELAHVRFLRTALGSARVARPAIDIRGAFTTVARVSGLIGPHDTIDPYANEDTFLLAAFLFEDVGVTAYKGASPFITDKTFLEAAAGLLSVESYHAAIVRTSLQAKGMADRAQKISDLRDALDGSTDLDQGLVLDGQSNLVPTDANGLTFSRSTGQVLNIVYGTPKAATSGLFFPAGVNGTFTTSAASG